MRRNLTRRLQSGLSIPTSFSNPPYEYENIKADVITSDISKAFHLLFLKHFFSPHFAALYLPVANTFMHSFKFMVKGHYWCYLMSGFCTTNYHWFKNLEVRKGCFIFECTVLDFNCDRLRESQFGILCLYWSTLKLLPVLLFRGKNVY